MSQSGTQTQIAFINWRKKRINGLDEGGRTVAVLTTRYTQKFKMFEVSRLGLPVSHSGQKVIHLRNICYMRFHGKRVRREPHPP
jgi:hypothetical protein